MHSNRFILNSDYLSFGGTKRSNVTFNIPSLYLPAGSPLGERWSTTLYMPSIKGTLDRYAVRINDSDYISGYFHDLFLDNNNSRIIRIIMNRDGDNIIIKEVAGNTSTTGYTVPAIKLDLSVYSFAPPNIS